jgi:16S rRNA U516 pseudouridylate synthase RsuA-like enzyme
MDDTTEDGVWLGNELHEGRKRQVRRMLAVAGLRLVELRRARVGPLTLGKLEPGDSRLLTEHEVAALRKAVGLG